MFKLIVICCLASLALGFVRPLSPHGRIVGGRATSIEQYPHQVSILYHGEHVCGGSIISTTCILTAAHCVVYDASKSQTVRVGSTFIHQADGVEMKVRSSIRHPKYDSNGVDYDYGLIRLVNTIKLGPGAQIIPLPEQGEWVTEGSLAEISGWGTLSSFGGVPTILQIVEVPIISQGQCKAVYGSTITDRMLCAKFEGGGRDACQGDSGGPMIQGGKLIGIVSWGLGCADPRYPGVYASVADQRNWIRKMTGV